MLDQIERYRVLKHRFYLCTVGFLPTEIDISSWEIHPSVRSAWKRILCRISYATYCLHGVFQALNILRVFMSFQSTPLYQVVLHTILVYTYAITSFWYYLLYVKNPGTNAAVVRMTLTGSVDGSTFIYATITQLWIVVNSHVCYRQQLFHNQRKRQAIIAASDEILSARSDHSLLATHVQSGYPAHHTQPCLRSNNDHIPLFDATGELEIMAVVSGLSVRGDSLADNRTSNRNPSLANSCHCIWLGQSEPWKGCAYNAL